jgi:GT2 family glycosyltransferase
LAVVASFNGSRWISKCLESLLESRVPLSVMVVDNASTDATPEIVKAFPAVESVLLSKNLGFGRASNIGIANALQRQMDYVLLLNQDARVDPETVGTLLDRARREPGTSGVWSPLHLNGAGWALDQRFLQYLAQGAPTLLSDCLLQRVREDYEVPFVNAAAWLVPVEVFRRIGGFDPVVFMYAEDVDFCNRLRFHDLRTRVVPRALAYHDRDDRPAAEPDRWRAIRRTMQRMTGELTAALKDPARGAGHSVSRWLGGWFAGSPGSAWGLGAGRLVALLGALCATLGRLPRILRHRRQARTVGAHWLTEECVAQDWWAVQGSNLRPSD